VCAKIYVINRNDCIISMTSYLWTKQGRTKLSDPGPPTFFRQFGREAGSREHELVGEQIHLDLSLRASFALAWLRRR